MLNRQLYSDWLLTVGNGLTNVLPAASNAGRAIGFPQIGSFPHFVYESVDLVTAIYHDLPIENATDQLDFYGNRLIVDPCNLMANVFNDIAINRLYQSRPSNLSFLLEAQLWKWFWHLEKCYII